MGIVDDVKFLIDDSPSMVNHWAEAKAALMGTLTLKDLNLV